MHQLPPFVALLDRHQHSCDTNLAEQLTYQGEEHLQLFLTICNRAEQLSLNSSPSSESRELHRDLWELFSLLNRKLGRFSNFVEGSLEGAIARTTTLSTTVSSVHCGTRGRPSSFPDLSRRYSWNWDLAIQKLLECYASLNGHYNDDVQNWGCLLDAICSLDHMHF